MTRLAMLIVAAAVAASCSAGDRVTADSTEPRATTTIEATTTTTEAETATTQATTITTEAPTADEGGDSPGSEQVGVGEKVTITILDEDGNVVGP